MQNSLKEHVYWLVAAIVILFLIIGIYPFSIFNKLKYEVTREEAIEIAQKYLGEHGFKADTMMKEAFIDNSPVENKYLLKQLGDEGFDKYLQINKWSVLSWVVMFHQNLPRQIAQTTYYVDVSYNGKVFGFTREIPDSHKSKSLMKDEAQSLIQSKIVEMYGNDFQQFSMVEYRQIDFLKRTDHSFRWEKNEPDLNGKTVITGNVQGDVVGSFHYYFEVPQKDREYFSSLDAIYGTVSVIFIIGLIITAISMFLKKYHQGEVWMNVGKSLFILYYVSSIISLINYWPGLGQGMMIGNLSFVYTKLIAVVINGFILYLFLGLLLFTAWSVSESYARSLWPEKLIGADAFIKGHLTSRVSGFSILRGLVLGTGITLTGILGSIILNKPDSNIFITATSAMDIFVGWIPVLSLGLNSIVEALITSIAVAFFTITTTYQRWKRKWISIVATGATVMLSVAIIITPPSLNNFGINLLSHFIFGCFLAFLFFKYDLLTLGSTLFHLALTSKIIVLAGSSNSFFTINFIISVMLLLISVLIYVISVIRKKDFVLESYGLPSHVLRISERERLKKELEIAARVQLSLLPKEDPKIPGYEIASISIPAIEAGGDYFDFVKLAENKMGIAIGDVSGKGVGAAIYMTLTKGILQAHAEEDVSPKNVLQKVNRLLYKTIEKNSFVSMFYAILDIDKNTINYSRAGHNPGILTTNEGNTKLLLSRGMALGLEEGSIFASTLSEEEVDLNKGDVFLLYTDGFSEAMNEKHEEYSETRLVSLIEKHKNESARELINIILKDVNKFVDNYPQHDDMTMLVVKRLK
ncbi:MAG: SpoIIE family protein phosphatase [Melioribacteraceae bacterium]|nr:SpoIIE family protein phosphatase [Melioribacteraceae bacterium]